MSLRGFVRLFASVLSLLALSIPLRAAPNAVPQLNPVLPASIAPGGPDVTISVTGTGFVSGSVVNWNNSPLATTFVHGAKLTAVVPAAKIASPTTGTITVFSPGPGGGTSNAQFVTVENSVVLNYFTPSSLTGSNSLTSPLAEGDFNNDGKLDVVVAAGSTVYVLKGNGDGTYAPAVGSAGPANSVISGIHVADINNDGKLDLIVNGKRGTTGLAATMLGAGNGTFQAPVETTFSLLASSSVVAADFNGDGIWDVALVGANAVQVLLGNANGTFSVGPTSALSFVGRDGIAAGDFNGDGKLDLVITAFDPYSQGYNFAGVLLGNGDGSFGGLQEAAGSGSTFVGSITAAVADFNGDGKLDIATAIQTAGATIQGLLYLSNGNGDGTFTVGTSVPGVVSVTTPLLVGDFNADGNLDLASGGFVYYGAGDGSFPGSNGSSGTPTLVLAGDANGDGLLDLFDETVTVQSSRSGVTTLAAIGLELQVPPLPDFKGIVAPLNTNLFPGGSVSFNVSVTPLYGFSGDVTLGITGLPNGMSPSYSPVTVHGGNGSSTVTLSATNALPVGNYTVTLSGNSGSLSHSTTVPVTVNSSPGDFGGTISPNVQNIARGSSAVYPITIIPSGGFNGPVTLSVSNLPPGATAAFSQNPVTGGSGTTNLTITTTGSTPSPQVYAPMVTAVSGLLSHSQTVYLGVAPQARLIAGTITPLQSVSASAGGTASYTLNLVTENDPSNSDTALTVSEVPTGATAAFTPTTINTGTGTSTLGVVVPAGTLTPGTYTLLITMTGSGVVAQYGASLVVNP